MKKLTLTLLAGSVALLTGCIDRGAADQKLVKGCKAAIEAFLYEGESVGNIVSQTIHDHAKLGKGYRQIMLDVTITDGFHPRDESHSCVFMEEFSFGQMSHRASIYQLNFGGRIIGQENYEIQGTIEEMQTLTGAIDKAMH